MDKDTIIFGRVQGERFVPTSEDELIKDTGLSLREMKIIVKASLTTYGRVHAEIADIVKACTENGKDLEAEIYRWLARLPSVTIDKKLFENL